MPPCARGLQERQREWFRHPSDHQPTVESEPPPTSARKPMTFQVRSLRGSERPDRSRAFVGFAQERQREWFMHPSDRIEQPSSAGSSSDERQGGRAAAAPQLVRRHTMGRDSASPASAAASASVATATDIPRRSPSAHIASGPRPPLLSATEPHKSQPRPLTFQVGGAEVGTLPRGSPTRISETSPHAGKTTLVV